MPERDLAWIEPAEAEFRRWLAEEVGAPWTAEALARPDIRRWTVGWIVYESLFESRWCEPWFVDGIRSFGLLALEGEGEITIEGSGENARVRLRDGREFGLDDFLAGESAPIRHDPGFADLDWSPVSAMAHLLAEYGAG